MTSNRGKTTLKTSKPSRTPMRDFDHLPPELRRWLAQADLPWRAKSVERAYEKALRKFKDPKRALKELDELQTRKVAKDAKRIWGEAHPSAA